MGDKPDTRGTAFVVYDDIYDAKNAVDHLSGFNVCGRYLIVLYYQVWRVLRAWLEVASVLLRPQQDMCPLTQPTTHS